MPIAVEGSRLITVNGTVYRWRLRREPSCNQECFDTPLTFAVELADSSGSVLAVAIPDVSHPGSPIDQSSLIVRPALVAAVIQAALDRGWQPAALDAPFRLNVASGDLPAEDTFRQAARPPRVVSRRSRIGVAGAPVADQNH
jgi:hypothetical protein